MASLAPELDLGLSGRRGDDAEDRKKQLIGQQHLQPPLPHHLWCMAREGGYISEVAGCTIALAAPFPSSSPRYEISQSFAYMHTQEDAGKNAMTNSEAGQASISD